MDFYQAEETLADKLLGKLILIGKSVIYTGLTLSSGLSLLAFLDRMYGLIATGHITHSADSANMEASEAVRVLADLFASFVYGWMFGIPLGMLIGVLIVIGAWLYGIAKRIDWGAK